MTPERLRLTLLGPPTLSHRGQPVHLATRKALAILAYAAVERQGAARAELAALLWPETPEDQARASLRQELSRLSKALGDGLVKPGSQVLALSPEHFEVDVWEFWDAFEAGDFAGAAGHHRGSFLQGLQLRDASEFEHWQDLTRAQLLGQYLSALDGLAGAAEAAGRLPEALGYRRQAIAADPLAERQYVGAMRLSEGMGDRAGALRLYQTLGRVLSEELGVEPGAEAQAALARLGGPEGGAVPRQARLPAPATPLVGRATEVGDVLALLGRPDCRLVSLVGPGGVGKSRLALAVAEELSGARPVTWVALQGRGLLPSLAEALGLALLGRGDIREAVLHQLGGGETLLVLDEAEDLAETQELEALLRDLGGLKLLVTTRQRLRLRSEWVYEAHGLAVGAPGREAQSPAVELFRRSAERHSPGFDPGPEELRSVAQICELLSGLPLAIEMAAAWVRLMPCAEIAAELGRSLELLEGSGPAASERHASLRAVLESTLGRLRQEERRALARLAVFRGGFGLEAARAVAGATPALLAALSDHALLARAEGGYRILAVIRQFLGPEVPQEAHQAHAGFYARLLAGRAEGLRGGDQPGALRELGAAGENLRAAWDWAVGSGQPELARGMADGLFLLYELRSLFRDGAELFAEASRSPRPELRAPALARRGRMLLRLSEFAPARECLEEALGLARELGERGEVAFCANNLGLVLLGMGYPLEARGRFEEALALRQGDGNRWGVANGLYNLGLVATHLGETEAARQRYQEALELYRALGDLRGTGLALTGLGQAWTSLGQYAVAREVYRQSLSYGQQLGDQFTEAGAQLGLGTVAGIEYQNEECRARLQASLEAAQPTGDQVAIGRALVGLGRLAMRDGELERALRLQRQALGRFQSIHHRWGTALALSHLGRSYTALGEPEEGKAHYRLSLQEAISLQAAPLALRALAGMAPGLEPPLAAQVYALVVHHPAADAWVREEARRAAGGEARPPELTLEEVARRV